MAPRVEGEMSASARDRHEREEVEPLATRDRPPLFPFERKCPFDPPRELARLRDQEPVSRVRLFDDKLAWLVTRYEDVRTVCADARFSAATTHPAYPEVFAGRSGANEKERTFAGADPPQHDVHRRMLASSFMAKRAVRMRPAIQHLASELLDDMMVMSQPVDLVSTYALPIPTAVICWLLGVPVEDHLFFQERASVRMNVNDPPELVAKATSELMDYLSELVTERERKPDDDLISKLLEEQVRTGHLTRYELVDMARMLLTAGHGTTASMIGLSVLVLLKNPDQLQEMLHDPGLVAGAIDELLRYLTVAQLLVGRVATEDIELSGRIIRAGDGVRALLSSANRDIRVFGDPDSFDIHRSAPSSHLAFGYGLHECLGQHFVRVEMEVALTALFRRLPTLRLAVPVDELSFKYDSATHGVHTLPVTW
jgi:cytochrome P450